MVRIFQIVSVILAAIAAYFLWMENKDGVFVAIVLAACSWFLNMRFQAKARIDGQKKGEARSVENGRKNIWL
ncbi:MAG: hypothetical protein ACKVRN_12915 [Pyrinomonadaceae bacterium]